MRLAKTEKAKVKLVPVGSPYEDDLEMEKSVTGKGAESTAFEFTGVADGRYKVMLVAEAGKWSEKETSSFQVEHDESESDVNDGADHASSKDIDATELRWEVRGVVANNNDGNDRLSRDETVAGVELSLYKTKKVGGTSADKNRYVKTGSAVGTAETDADGLYVFSDIAPGNYIVEAAAGSDYEAVRPRGNSLSHGKGGKATDVVNMAFGAATRPSTATTIPVPTAPQWNAMTSAFSNMPNAVSFALLYTNGRLSGDVEDRSSNRMHGDATVDVRRCLTIEDADGDTEGFQSPHRCEDFDGFEVLRVDVASNGSWDVDDLREGYYEVEIDPPGGYGSVDSTGVVAANGAGEGGTYWVRQAAQLTALRPRESTKTFYIARLGASRGADTGDLTLTVGGNACGTGTDVCDTLRFDVGSLKVTAALGGDSDGGMVELWSGDVAQEPRLPTTKKLATLQDNRAATITVNRGTTALYPVIISEQGYSRSDGDSQYGAVHRNQDTRLEKIVIEWQGGSKTVSRAELEAMTDFLADEGRATDDIEDRDTVRPVDVTISLPNSAAGDALTVTATAKTSTVTAIPSFSAIAAGADEEVNATLTDDGNSDNARTYAITIAVAGS